MANFPNQNIPEIQKDKDWCLKHFVYAEQLLKFANYRVEKYVRLYNVYNGKTTPASIAYLTSQYGKKNRTKYISYRVSRTKIDLLNNEFLRRPLEAQVYCTNESARTAALDNYEMMLGAYHAKDAIGKLNEVGVDPLEGMSIPNTMEDSEWAELSTKDKNVVLMQTILDEQIPALNLKYKLAKNFQDIEIASMCYGKVEVKYNGDENYRRLDPKFAIYEEIDDDYFLERSPLMGHAEEMPVHDILMSFSLTPADQQLLESIRQNGDAFINNGIYRNQYFYRNGHVCCNVIYLEWKSVEPEYYKISPKTKSQLDFDSSSDSYRIELNTEWYEKNKELIDKDVAAGKYQIETKFKEVIWEGVRIGHVIMPYCRKKHFTMRRTDNPAEVIGFSYTGCLFNTVQGERISLMEIMENFSNMFDIVMFQILKDLNKNKGKVLAFNRGALPKGKTIRDIMYNAFNDSFIDYDASGQSNMAGRDLQITDMLKEFDLGLSSSFPQLIALKREIMDSIDRLTGINENREGQIAATSTATNAQSSIQASRTITEGMFFLMALYTERVLLKVVETTKLTWGLYKTEKAKIILGDDKFKFMQITKDIAFQDYGIHLTDGGRQLDIRDKMDRYAEAALNAKDIRYKDLVAFELSPTLADANKVLNKAFAEMEKIRQQNQTSEQQAAAAQQQAALQMQRQIAAEDRAANEENVKQNIILEADEKIRVEKEVHSSKSMDKLILDQNKHDNEFYNGQA